MAIRTETVPIDAGWEEYLHWPWIDRLREVVEKEDMPAVIKLIGSQKTDHRILGIAICRRLQYSAACNESIRHALQQTWKDNPDYYT